MRKKNYEKLGVERVSSYQFDIPVFEINGNDKLKGSALSVPNSGGLVRDENREPEIADP